MSNCPAGNIEGMAAFSIGKNGYRGGGWNNSSSINTFWKYDTTTDTWASIASIPIANGLAGTPRVFVMGSKAYICIGTIGSGTTPMKVGYVYDTNTNAWTEFTNMGMNGIERYYAFAFTIGNYGYIGTGVDSAGTKLKDFWQYYPCADTALSVNTITHSGNSVSIYPNPTDGKINLRYNGTEQQHAVFTIMDMTGRVILSQKIALSSLQITTINANTLAEGMYFYRVTIPGKVLSTGKFVMIK